MINLIFLLSWFCAGLNIIKGLIKGFGGIDTITNKELNFGKDLAVSLVLFLLLVLWLKKFQKQ